MSGVIEQRSEQRTSDMENDQEQPSAPASGCGAFTEWQKKVLRWCERGCGVDASPAGMTAKQRRECDALVQMGLIRKSKNHSSDKFGMFVAVRQNSEVTKERK